MGRAQRRSRAGFRLAAWLALTAGAALLALAAWDLGERAVAYRGGRLALESGVGEPPAAEDTRPAPPEPAAPPRPGSVVARIVVPSAGVDTIAFEGVDRRTLRRGAGHFPGTALPGRSGNAGFAAHRDGAFRGLRAIAAGDEILVEVPEATYRYRVSELRVVEPAAVDVVASRGRDELTLVTCHPFDWVGPAPRRLVVHADLVGWRAAPSGDAS